MKASFGGGDLRRRVGGGVHLEDMQNTDEDESQSHLEMEQGHCRIQRAY